jgi:Tfp pilus assembly protein PilF
MPAIFSFFNLITIFYGLLGLRLANTLWQEREQIRQEPLTPQKKNWGDEAAFYLAVPVGVVFHELGHAIAVWFFGGRVVEFGYRLFWGFVRSAGNFTPAENWTIAVAGTVGSLLYGFAIWLLLHRSSNSSVRYFGLRAARFQIFFSLIYYPIFTLIGFVGDWETIYNFGATPLLSSMTAGFHITLLLLYWYLERRGFFEMPSFADGATQARYEALRDAALHDPAKAGHLNLIQMNLQGGAIRTARIQLQALLKDNPQSAEAHLQMGMLLSQKRNRVTRKAVRHLERALELGLSGKSLVGVAAIMLGQYYLSVEKYEEGLRVIDRALAALSDDPGNLSGYAQAYALRGTLNQRLGRNLAAEQDLQRAIDLSSQNGEGESVGRYQQQLEQIRR